MSELETPLNFEELPKDAPSRSHKITKKKGHEMPEPITQSTIIKRGNKMKQYQVTRGEHIKDLIIAVLVTAIVAFGLGTMYQNRHNAEIQKAVAAATVQPVKK